MTRRDGAETGSTIKMARKNPFFLKIYFLVALLAIALASFLYVQDIIFKLEGTSMMQSRIFARFSTAVSDEDESGGTEKIIFDEIISKISFPVIVADSSGLPLSWRNIGSYDTLFSDMLTREDTIEISRIMSRLDSENKPIEIKYNDRVFAVVHYGQDALYKRLQFAPFFQIIVTSIFLLIGIYGFLLYRKSEENIIWAGMAKETAHQIGTPLSSLSGWMEILRQKKHDPAVISGLEEDIERLNMISSRFNKIGSPLSIEMINVNEEVNYIIDYFKKRTPKSGEYKISFKYSHPDNCSVPADRELFRWAVENIIKNAIDALRNKSGGIIEISSAESGGRMVLKISDNGEGIDKKNIDKVFSAGFSTKEHGWGIGLALAKKIIEEFHGGKLYLEYTMKDSGTTLVINLPLSKRKNEAKNFMD